jgi:hypothetical protein
MTHQTIDLHVNPSDETVRLGPLAVRFLMTFEPAVPGARLLAAPAHSHSQDENAICVSTSAAILPQYFGESAEGFNETEGGELARW